MMRSTQVQLLSQEWLFDAQSLASNGFVILPNFLPDHTTQDVAHRLGTVIDMRSLLPNYDTVQDLRPTTIGSVPKNHYSGNFGLDRFPLHTDFAHWAVPPRYLLLRCISGTDSVATHMLGWKALLPTIARNTITRAVFRSRKRRDGCTGLLRALSSREGAELFRWDSLFLTPQNDSAKDLQHVMRAIALEGKTTDIVLAQPNDTILIDNWRTLHGRSAVATSQMHRHIQRVYLMEVFSDSSSG